MDSVNDMKRSGINFLTGSLFRSPDWRATRALRASRRNVVAMKQLLVAVALSGAVAIAVHSSSVNAELENQIFTSRAHKLRLVVPRGWRATDQPSYPGLLVWMLRSQPDGKMVLTAEPFTRQVYCS